MLVVFSEELAPEKIFFGNIMLDLKLEQNKDLRNMIVEHSLPESLVPRKKKYEMELQKRKFPKFSLSGIFAPFVGSANMILPTLTSSLFPLRPPSPSHIPHCGWREQSELCFLAFSPSLPLIKRVHINNRL